MQRKALGRVFPYAVPGKGEEVENKTQCLESIEHFLHLPRSMYGSSEVDT